MERVFVDTSGWVALFVENDKYHKKAKSIFENIKKSKAIIYTSDYVVDETITTIRGKGGYKQSLLAGNVFFTSKIIEIVLVSPDHFQNAWQLYQKYRDKEFSFTDVTSFSIIKSFNIKKAFAFDRHFLQVGIESCR